MHVLSKRHTKTAATTITRLRDLGVEACLLRSALLGVLSQRLTRRNCLHCRKVEIVPPHWREALQVGPNEVFYRGTGCRKCEGLNVNGRIAVYELMTIIPAIRRLNRPHSEADSIHEAALHEGMIPNQPHAGVASRALLCIHGQVRVASPFGSTWL